MTTHSIIKKSELEGALRIDAEYYQPEYLRISNLVKDRNRFTTLRQLKVRCDASAFYPALEPYYGQGDIPFLRVADVDDGIDYDNILTIPKEILARYKTLNLGKKGDIVITKGGTVGRIGLVAKDSALTRDLIFFDTSKLTEDDYTFFYVYCLTDFYKEQLLRSASMTAQPHLTITSVREIPLFNPQEEFKTKIVSIFKKSSFLSEESKSLYSQAENLLLEESGIKRNIENYENLSNIVNLSDILKVKRMDAEYFQDRFGKLAGVTDFVSRPLEEFVTLKKGLEPGSDAYQDEGKLFIRVSSLSKDGITDKDQKYLKEELYTKLKKDYQPKVGEILLTKDATPGIAYVVKEPIEGLISGGVLRLKVNDDIEPEYVALCINSVLGQWQVERDAGGSIIKHWKPEQVKKMVIPIASKQTQEKIADLVRKSHEARKKSKELLEEAKRKVEDLIENT